MMLPNVIFSVWHVEGSQCPCRQCRVDQRFTQNLDLKHHSLMASDKYDLTRAHAKGINYRN
jgi:hypothetical protein